MKYVAKYLNILSKLTSERLENANKKWLLEPFFSLQPSESNSIDLISEEN